MSFPITTQQPTGQAGYPGGNVALPMMAMNCPPGLEYLTAVDQLLVKQKVEVLEMLIGFESANKYKIMNSMGQKVYYAAEDSDCCTRNCCGPGRCFDMKILDNNGSEIMHLNRPLRCQCCWCCCFRQEMEISSPPGTVIGTIHQDMSFCKPYFTVKNAAGEATFKIVGPCIQCRCCADVVFKVLGRDGVTEIGTIRKQWTGLLKEAFTDADHFGITFPMDLDVTMKATLLGALFLIDFMFFETKNEGILGGVLGALG